MKLTSKILEERITQALLRLALISTSILTLVFGLYFAMEISKNPIVVERGCESTLAKIAGIEQTKEELNSYLKKAVSVRFDTDASVDPSIYLVNDMLIARTKEQEELKSKEISQSVITREIRRDGDKFLIDADRILAIGSIRSALPIKLVAKVSSKTRSLSNPYGLILTSITAEEVKK